MEQCDLLTLAELLSVIYLVRQLVWASQTFSKKYPKKGYFGHWCSFWCPLVMTMVFQWCTDTRFFKPKYWRAYLWVLIIFSDMPSRPWWTFYPKSSTVQIVFFFSYITYKEYPCFELQFHHFQSNRALKSRKSILTIMLRYFFCQTARELLTQGELGKNG